MFTRRLKRLVLLSLLASAYYQKNPIPMARDVAMNINRQVERVIQIPNPFDPNNCAATSAQRGAMIISPCRPD